MEGFGQLETAEVGSAIDRGGMTSRRKLKAFFGRSMIVSKGRKCQWLLLRCPRPTKTRLGKLEGGLETPFDFKGAGTSNGDGPWPKIQRVYTASVGLLNLHTLGRQLAVCSKGTMGFV